MTDDISGLEFSRAWTAAWNRRDVEAVLAHFHEDVVFTSPIAQQIGFSGDGVVRGKDALRRYWNAALARNPELCFRVTAVYQGVATLVIAFQHNDLDRVEVLTFKDGLVIEGHGTFLAG